MSALLPLFPLDLVLLPGMSLPLHIFEPRYREMIAECLRLNQPFGVVRALEDGIARVGCTAEITEVLKRHEDGRIDILTHGMRRFELILVDQEQSYLRAEVTYLSDDGDQPTSEERSKALHLYGEIMTLAGEEGATFSADVTGLSFLLAAALPLDPDFKQTLLATDSEAIRIRALVDYCGEILPKLQRVVRARKSATGNGHAH